MVARQTSFTDSLPQRIFSCLPLPGKVKRVIREIYKRIRRYDTSAFAEPGTLNNQQEREKAVRVILHELQPSAIIETGTYLGAGAKFFLSNTQHCPIFSCEIDARFFSFCTERFRNESRLLLFHGKSVDFLKWIDGNQIHPDANIVCYLDAHWGKDLPLRDEMNVILARWLNALIVIDNFAVPHDKGYRYDNYGKHNVLNADYLHKISDQLLIFYPKVVSGKETGARSGCCFSCFADTKAHAILLRHPDLFVNY